jgi:2-polyprenyl-3-methyl-5-hydroxy-6-metoxy-1,4-benzoquinol methylase
MKVHQVTACTVCGAGQATDVRISDEHSVRQCSECGTVFAPAYADPEDIYVDDYLLGQGRQATPFGIHFDLLDARFQAYLQRVGHARMHAIEDATGMRTAGSGPSLLDVGCGTGEVLAAAQERGWEATGVEPIAKEAAFARDERGVNVLTSTLEASGLPMHAFDVVSAFHVLEHIPAPAEFLRSIARWAKPGGHVVVEVPNFGGRARLRSEQFGGWRHLRPLEHINHFTPTTLSQAFTLAGLEPLTTTAPTYTGPPQTPLEGLDDLVRNRWTPLVKRLPTSAAWRLLHLLERSDDRAGTGMVVFGVARVPG